jgi:hypothetical protein
MGDSIRLRFGCLLYEQAQTFVPADRQRLRHCLLLNSSVVALLPFLIHRWGVCPQCAIHLLIFRSITSLLIPNRSREL